MIGQKVTRLQSIWNRRTKLPINIRRRYERKSWKSYLWFRAQQNTAAVLILW